MNYKKEEIKEYAIEQIKEKLKYDENYLQKDILDIHFDLFNTDYYIIGSYKATKWLGNKAFEIIEFIKDCETEQFGEVYTDFSEPERIVNMYTYIIGEQIFNHINYNYDGELTKKDIKNIIKDIKEL